MAYFYLSSAFTSENGWSFSYQAALDLAFAIVAAAE